MLLLLAATPLETTLLRPMLQQRPGDKQFSYTLFCGELQGQPIILAHSGIGPAMAAMQLTRLLEKYRFSTLLLFGCAGSYPQSGLKNGDLALASHECFGDLGIAGESEFTPLSQLEIPTPPSLSPPCPDDYPLSTRHYSWAQQLLPQAQVGRFVTVSACTGTPLLSQRLAERSAGICENMEGAAVAQVCAEFQLPMLELRGISNPTGSRNPEEWDLKLAAKTAQNALLKLLEHWHEGPF